MKKLLSILLCFAVVFSAIPVAFADTTTAMEGFAGGDGTSGNPYKISDASELMYFRDQINNGNGLEAYYKLTANIDLQGQNWTPIGSGANIFKGNFAGNEHVISNFTITKKATVNTIVTNQNSGTEDRSSDSFYGFFASVDGSAQVTKLGLDGVTVTPSVLDGNVFIGIFSAGTGYGSNIQSCFVKNATININSGTPIITGFSARAHGQVKGCYVDNLTLNATGAAGGNFAPFGVNKAYVGYMSDCFASNIYFNSTSTNKMRLYDFGTVQSGQTTLTNCYSTFDSASVIAADTTKAQAGTGISGTSVAQNTVVTAENLNALNLTFSTVSGNPRYQVSKSGGAPLLAWERNVVIYTMTVASPSGGTVEVSSESVEEGETVTVTATPSEGYKLTKITANGEVIGTYDDNVTDARTVTHTPTDNTEYSAVFVEIDPVLNPGLGHYVKPYTETVTEFKENTSYNSASNITFSNMPADESSTSAYMNLVTNSTSDGSTSLWIPTKQKALALKHTLEFDFKYDGMTTNSDRDNANLVSITETFKPGNYDKLSLKVSSYDVSNENQYKLVLADEHSTPKQSDALATLVKGTWYKFVLDVDAIIGEAKLTVYNEQGEEIGSIAYTSLSFKRDFEETMSSILQNDQFRPVPLSLSTAADTIVNFRNIKTTQEMFEIPNAPTLSLENATLKADLTAYYFDAKQNLVNTLPPMYIAVYSETTGCLASYDMVKQEVTMGVDFVKGNAQAKIDLSEANLEDGQYKVKVFVWTDSCAPYTGAITKILTVNGSNYDLVELE